MLVTQPVIAEYYPFQVLIFSVLDQPPLSHVNTIINSALFIMSAGTLDVSRYMHGSAGDRVQFARDFVSALIKDGYAKLRNHGILQEDVREIFSWVI